MALSVPIPRAAAPQWLHYKAATDGVQAVAVVRSNPRATAPQRLHYKAATDGVQVVAAVRSNPRAAAPGGYTMQRQR